MTQRKPKPNGPDRLQIEHRNLADLRPRATNPRTHDAKQIAGLGRSIKSFGFNSVIAIDEQGVILAGHARYEAAKLIGLSEVPTVTISHLTDKEKRAFVIADNRLAERSDWDLDLLRHEIAELGVDIGFDVTITGFETPEIDILLADAQPAKQDADDERPPLASVAVSRRGDLWRCGDHLLLCADCRDNSALEQLMGETRARLIITDPPYQVRISGHARKRNAHREFIMASGEMTSAEFAAFLKASLGAMAQASMDGAVHYVFMDWRHLPELNDAASKIYRHQLNLCIWSKTNGGMGSFYRSQHELVGVFKVGTAPHVNNIALGSYGRYRTNVWTYVGVNAFGRGRDKDLADHPTVKPTALIADAILDASHRGDLVLDGFAGSGTILVAAERVGRRARAIEIDPLYVDVALRRWEARTGSAAVLVETGESFAAVTERRCSEADQSSDVETRCAE